MTADATPLRRLAYPLLITVAVAAVGGRILAVTRVYEPHLSRTPENQSGTREPWQGPGDKDTRGPWPAVRPRPMPTLGANDRSRWATIRALVDEGTYAIGRRDPARATPQNPHGDSGIVTEDGWGTIDKVLIGQEFYSSKPPLLPTLLAGEYWFLKQVFGLSITDPRGEVVRVILLTVNWLPLVFFLVVLARLAETLGATDWGRLYVLAAGCFATYLVPFAITLNNHTVATWSALYAVYFGLSAWERRPVGVWEGGNLRSWESENGEDLALPPARVAMLSLSHTLAGFFAGFTASNELPAFAFLAALFLILLVRRPGPTLVSFLPAALLPVGALLLTNSLAIGRLTPAYGGFGGPEYSYAGSYWKLDTGEEKYGIDWAWQKEPTAAYVLNVLVGHHGLFSLTPVFLLGVAGMVMALARYKPWPPLRFLRAAPALPVLAALGLVLTVTVVVFYTLVVDPRTHNYGGWTSGPRWLMWLTPFLLLGALPCADWLAGRPRGRWLAYILLGVSVLSVSYPAWNPWRHPWLYDLFQALGWLQY